MLGLSIREVYAYFNLKLSYCSKELNYIRIHRAVFLGTVLLNVLTQNSSKQSDMTSKVVPLGCLQQGVMRF